MDYEQLEKDRFLRKDPKQSDSTKSAAYTALNPAPKRGDDSFRKVGRPKGSEEDDGAPNILTGTVIVSCFIQTSALPSRIELEGNDLTFFDDTYLQGGKIIGDTSRLVFTHASGKNGEVITQGFIWEKRASAFNTYDNVLSLYAVPAKAGAHNYMFFGRNATLGDNQRNTSTIRLAVDRDSSVPFSAGSPGVLNGIFALEYTIDGGEEGQGNVILGGNSEQILGEGFDGFTSLILAGDGGITGMAYVASGNINVLLYLFDETTIAMGADLLPDANNAYDIGSSSNRIATIYATSLNVSSVPSFTIGTLTVDTIQFVARNVTSLSQGQMAYHDNAGTQQFRGNAGGFFGSFDLTGV